LAAEDSSILSSELSTDSGAETSQLQRNQEGEEGTFSFSSSPNQLNDLSPDEPVFPPPATPGIRSAVIEMDTPRPTTSVQTSTSSGAAPEARLTRRTTFQDHAAEIETVEANNGTQSLHGTKVSAENTLEEETILELKHKVRR